MQTEKQRERLVELLNAEISHLVLSDIDLVWTCERINYLADYLIANNVVVLPENVTIYINPPIKEVKGKTITIPKWTYDEHKGETE